MSIDKLRQDKKDQQSLFNSTKQELKDLETENERLRAENKKLRTKNQSLVDDLDDLPTKLQTARRRINPISNTS